MEFYCKYFLSFSSSVKREIKSQYIRITHKNIEIVAKLLERNGLQEEDSYIVETIKTLERSTKENPYEDTMKIINTIPENNELGINAYDLAWLICYVSKNTISADMIIDIYNTIIKNDKIKKCFIEQSIPHYYDFTFFVATRAACTKENLEKIINDENLYKHADMLVLSKLS